MEAETSGSRLSSCCEGTRWGVWRLLQSLKLSDRVIAAGGLIGIGGSGYDGPGTRSDCCDGRSDMFEFVGRDDRAAGGGVAPEYPLL